MLNYLFTYKEILIIIFFLSILGNILVWKYGLRLIKQNRFQSHDTHKIQTSRLGGIIIFASLFLLSLITANKWLTNLLIFSLIIIIPAFMEDLHYKISPIIRLVLSLISSLFIILSIPELPMFEFGKINFFVNDNLFQIIFFTFALAGLTNGQNIIDGTNGLSAFTSIITITCIFYISIIVKDYQASFVTISCIVLLISFLFINYPFGFIFLGDSGSYLLGILSGYLIIKIFGENPDIPTWSAIVILFYPTFELIFSYFRKLLSRKSPFLPDNHHLHLKLYFYLLRTKKSKTANALVAPYLSIIWLTPLFLTPIILMFPNLKFFLILIMICFYLTLYYLTPKKEE